jgi:high-affinity nickel-transport protein
MRNGANSLAFPGRKQSDAAIFRHQGIFLLAVLMAVSAALWLATLIVLRGNPAWLALAAAAYGFGLRHAFDADHIAAIDSITRRQLAAGKRSTYVGLEFSLGHSTVVLVLALLLIIGIHQIARVLPQLGTIGAIVGGGFSVLLLLLVGISNIRVLFAPPSDHSDRESTPSGGLLNWLFRGIYRYATTGWQVFGIGVLFGLGFDTASEVAVLIIAAGARVHGLPIWYCILFPLLFASGMTLMDSADTVLISAACRWVLHNTQRSRIYNIALTLTTVMMALGIAFIELWGLLMPVRNGYGRPPRWIILPNTHFAALGGTLVVVTMFVWASLWVIARWLAASGVEQPISA